MRINAARANAALDSILAALNGGSLRFYSGSRPATVDTAATGTLLATVGFSATAFAPAASRSATANAITSDTSIDATGTAGYARGFASDGTTAVADFTVGVTGGTGEILLSSTALSAGARLDITAFTVSLPVGA